MRGWFEQAGALGLERGVSFHLDFHTIPFHGEDALIEKHYVSKRSRRQKGVLAFLAQDAERRVFCYANAGVRKAEQADEVLRFRLIKLRPGVGQELADAGRQPSKNSVDELYVSYTILEPATAKFKQTGRSHHQIYQTGRGGVSAPNKNSPLYSEYALKQAALETAERILAAFDIKLRDQR